MAYPINILTSDAVLDDLYPLVDGKKQTVRVNRDVLNRLLIDHGVMLKALRMATGTFTVTVPRRRERVKL